MIEDQLLKLEDAVYTWEHDAGEPPETSWLWRDSEHMVPPAATVEKLNRLFLEQCVPQMRKRLEPSEHSRLDRIIRSMGGSPSQSAGSEETTTSSEAGSHTPFNDVTLRDAFFADIYGGEYIIATIGVMGSGPFEYSDFDLFVMNKVCPANSVNEKTEILIVGREGWNPENIDRLIDARIGQRLRIYSQEMFLAYLANGVDPFSQDAEVLDSYRGGHPALEFVSQGWPGWVSTHVNPTTRRGRGTVPGDWPSESPLHAMGYHVGKDGVPRVSRRAILRKAFEEALPAVGPDGYMDEWDDPRTPGRLGKIAESIASHCRNMKRRGSGRSDEAIKNWEDDLAWLKQEFYRGHFRFLWPDTYVQ